MGIFEKFCLVIFEPFKIWRRVDIEITSNNIVEESKIGQKFGNFRFGCLEILMTFGILLANGASLVGRAIVDNDSLAVTVVLGFFDMFEVFNSITHCVVDSEFGMPV